MTRVEFLNRLNGINHQLRMLKDEYINSNCSIRPGNYVIVTCEGKEKRYYLKEYKIVDGDIKPIFNECLKDGSRGNSYRDISNFPGNITMRLA
jgi:hypothetical protein